MVHLWSTETTYSSSEEFKNNNDVDHIVEQLRGLSVENQEEFKTAFDHIERSDRAISEFKEQIALIENADDIEGAHKELILSLLGDIVWEKTTIVERNADLEQESTQKSILTPEETESSRETLNVTSVSTELFADKVSFDLADYIINLDSEELEELREDVENLKVTLEDLIQWDEESEVESDREKSLQTIWNKIIEFYEQTAEASGKTAEEIKTLAKKQKIETDEGKLMFLGAMDMALSELEQQSSDLNGTIDYADPVGTIASKRWIIAAFNWRREDYHEIGTRLNSKSAKEKEEAKTLVRWYIKQRNFERYQENKDSIEDISYTETTKSIQVKLKDARELALNFWTNNQEVALSSFLEKRWETHPELKDLYAIDEQGEINLDRSDYNEKMTTLTPEKQVVYKNRIESFWAMAGNLQAMLTKLAESVYDSLWDILPGKWKWWFAYMKAKKQETIKTGIKEVQWLSPRDLQENYGIESHKIKGLDTYISSLSSHEWWKVVRDRMNDYDFEYQEWKSIYAVWSEQYFFSTVLTPVERILYLHSPEARKQILDNKLESYDFSSNTYVEKREENENQDQAISIKIADGKYELITNVPEIILEWDIEYLWWIPINQDNEILYYEVLYDEWWAVEAVSQITIKLERDNTWKILSWELTTDPKEIDITSWLSEWLEDNDKFAFWKHEKISKIYNLMKIHSENDHAEWMKTLIEYNKKFDKLNANERTEENLLSLLSQLKTELFWLIPENKQDIRWWKKYLDRIELT